MSSEISRTRRVAEQIKRELSSLLQYEVKDPRVKLVNVNAVNLSPDFGHAKVYVGSLQTDADHEAMVDALNKMAGFLRKELGRELHMRNIPQLRFFYDDTAQRGNELTSLIEDAVSEDKQKREESGDLDPLADEKPTN
jgi:ribosome-binding factor A